MRVGQPGCHDRQVWGQVRRRVALMLLRTTLSFIAFCSSVKAEAHQRQMRRAGARSSCRITGPSAFACPSLSSGAVKATTARGHRDPRTHSAPCQIIVPRAGHPLVSQRTLLRCERERGVARPSPMLAWGVGRPACGCGAIGCKPSVCPAAGGQRRLCTESGKPTPSIGRERRRGCACFTRAIKYTGPERSME